ncbi:MAG: ribonuclease J [Pyrinomonadaceae bacterium]
MNECFEIMPLGGIGEFGMNCLAIRYGGEMIVLDAGMGFPEETPYGVDIAIPDFSYLDQYADELVALVLTHGHEDHIGAVPFFLKKFNVPVYASNLTAAFIDRKLEEHGILDEVLVHRVEAGEEREIGLFDVGFIHASHSLVDCFSIAVTTDGGTIIHTGDYKIDETPVIGDPYDLEMLREYGDRGVLALLADSTNATVPGRTPSETAVIPDFKRIFEEAEGRLIVTTFSSSIHRLQIVFDIAAEFGRRVCLLGRSMLQNVETAEELGFLEIDPETRVSLGESRALPDDEVVYLVTGSQAETRAVLWNLATQSYKGLSIRKGDTVVLSARIIPGNEKRISKMIGAIYRNGGNIIEEKRRLIHVSGHASQEDIRIMIESVRPRYLVPIHGEYRMLFRQKEFARNHLGFSGEDVMLVEDGDVLEVSSDGASIIERNEVLRIFIGDTNNEEIEFDTVRERKKLAFGGLVSLVLMVDETSGDVVGEPQITFSGVSINDKTNGFYPGVKDAVKKAYSELGKQNRADRIQTEEALRLAVKKYLNKRVSGKPVIVTSVVSID